MKHLLSILCLFVLSCDDDSPPSVEYLVTGTATSIDVTLSNASENTEQYSNKSLPYSYTFDSASGNFLYIFAQNQGLSGSVTTTIYINDAVFETATSYGGFVIASASGTCP